MRKRSLLPYFKWSLVFVGVFGFLKLDFWNPDECRELRLVRPLTTQRNTSARLLGRKYLSLCEDRLIGNHRTGNHLFMLAAMIDIARKTGRRIVMPRYGWRLDDVFDFYSSDLIGRVDDVCEELGSCTELRNPHYGYDRCLDERWYVENLEQVEGTLLMCGLAQTYQYSVNETEQALRDVLKFYPSTSDKADEILSSPPSKDGATYFRVGVHVRRGDFLEKPQIDYGITTADVSYYKKAFRYFTSSHEHVWFIIVSDDIPWAMENLPRTADEVVVTYSNQTLDVDLAILSKCDAVIMSTGTFGWWGAWLANKTTIYYKNYPKPDSVLSNVLKGSSYYPPHWIPME